MALHENWPSASSGRGCACRRCRARAADIDRLADRSLSAALAHAQNRGDGAEADAWGYELTIDRRVSVVWSRRVPLDRWLRNPTSRPGDTPPDQPSQWLYKFFLGDDPKPLYLGRSTGQRGQNRRLTERIDEHLRGTRIPRLARATVAERPALVRQLINRNKALLRAGDPNARGESQMIADILASLPRSAFQISVAEVRRLDPRRGPVRARGAQTAMAEKRYHGMGATRINSPDNPSFEDGAAPGADPGLARLVRRMLAGRAA